MAPDIASLPPCYRVFPETERLEQKLATLTLAGAPAPLKLGNSLDKFEKSDATPLVGTEFARGVQIAELLKAPNADQLIRDLVILGDSSCTDHVLCTDQQIGSQRDTRLPFTINSSHMHLDFSPLVA